jgi:EAL domain-containing protein (putative c-di-GMP-specific phosphodiesterase class I)
MKISSSSPARAAAAADIRGVLAAHAVGVVFQPLMSLKTGERIGYEALARGPAGTPLESPAALFAAAYKAGCVPELDWACRAAAFRAAIEADLDPSLWLFVNSEPVSLGSACPPELRDIVATAEIRLRVVMEVTERAVARDPAQLLAAVARARMVGWGVALDDVGAEPASLAVMPFVHPDVIKLDLQLIQGRTTVEVARIVNAVRAQAERTGAVVLAEGIETHHHEDIARAMGATVGQGFLYGYPEALPATTAAPHSVVRLLQAPATADAPTPWRVVTAQRQTERATKALLLPMSMHLEHKGLDASEPNVLLACFQDARNFGRATQRRFALLSTRAAFTGAVGVGMPVAPAAGVRGADLAADDPLRGEWDVVVIGPHFAAALVAKDCGDTGPDSQRRFDFTITHDRDLVIHAAQALLNKLAPA